MSSNMQLCTAHKKMRLEKFMVSRNVLDADGKVVDVKWSCHPDSQCTTGPGGALVGAPPPPVAAGSSGAAAGPPEEKSDAMKLYGGETRGRYFDLSAQTGGIDNTVKKVCFSCGMADHERGDCPNQFCRTCRGPIAPGGVANHTCVEPALSDFIDLRMPTPEEIANARCSVCNQLGHFDCASLNAPRGFRASCCNCGDTGHHGFQCSNAPHDRWLTHQLRLLGQALTERRQSLPEALVYGKPTGNEGAAKPSATAPPPPPVPSGASARKREDKRPRDEPASSPRTKQHMAEDARRSPTRGSAAKAKGSAGKARRR
eukprot:CAMPEP_0174830960 /NCGR_PEP_ID=MMETSP1114-20130205/2824_1 /TAXON_ID=312471 /ORGANISM="Neobodo designis, Strain CCAP 1951/1" /LENGTH=314 /DNA_ID=CAMNT_0016064771 /DNA_START=58 /DNA_END=999 /DNA_ORIENTATION=-